MIKLKNIVIENSIAKCDIFPEDSVENGYIEMSFVEGFTSVVLPKGYEWCMSHIDHAKRYLTNLYKKGVDFQSEKIIMWY